MATETPPEQDEHKLYQDIDAYSWDTDAEFQGGLAAILGPKANSTPSQTEELTLRARLFYYARKKNIPPVNFDAYKAHLANKTSLPAEETPPYPVPFADIVAMITSGQPIPGIKDIPPTVLSGQATQPLANKRRKPWEKEEPLAVEHQTFGDRRDDVIVQSMPDDQVTDYNEGVSRRWL